MPTCPNCNDAAPGGLYATPYLHPIGVVTHCGCFYDDRTVGALHSYRDAQLSDFVRVNGDCICTHCSRDYYSHPFTDELGYDGQPFLRRLCDGRIVKL